jgi:hypothetical protein
MEMRRNDFQHRAPPPPPSLPPSPWSEKLVDLRKSAGMERLGYSSDSSCVWLPVPLPGRQLLPAHSILCLCGGAVYIESVCFLFQQERCCAMSFAGMFLCTIHMYGVKNRGILFLRQYLHIVIFFRHPLYSNTHKDVQGCSDQGRS